jgi:hypothetical protein
MHDRPAHSDNVAPNEIEITPEMIEAGLVWLYAFSPETSDGKTTVREIIKVALANFPIYHRLVDCRRGN